MARTNTVSAGSGPAAPEAFGGGCQHAGLLVTKEALLAGVRVERAERQPRLGDAEPLLQRGAGDLAGAHDPVGGEQQRHIAKRDVGGDQDHAQAVARQHHRDVAAAGEVRQPFGVSGKRKTGEMQGMLLHRCGDDGVDFAAQGEPGGLLDGASGDQPGFDRGRAHQPVRGSPAAGADAVIDAQVGDLFLRPDRGDLGINTGLEHGGGDFRSDAPWIAQRDREPDARRHGARMSTYVRLRN